MASSFNQAFGSNFLQGLSPNQAPDPAILPGVTPAGQGQQSNALQSALTPETPAAPVGPAEYTAWLRQNKIPDSAEAFAHFQSLHGQVTTPQEAQAPDQAAPQPPANPGAPGQPQAPQQMLGQPDALPQSAMPAHGERKSFASVLQSLSDKANTAFGAPTTAQMQQAHQLALQASMLDNKAKNQNITQTGLENQTTANGVIGNFARGLGAIQAAGGDPAIAAPELAHQLGIPIGQAQAIVDQEKKQPGFLKILADNADKADKAEKFAMALTAATDKDGNPVFIQPGSSGTVKAVDGYKPIGQTSTIDSGDAVHVTDKRTGKDVRTITKSGGPATGEAPITDASGKVVGYHPLPGSIASTNQQKSQTEIDKARADVAAKQAKAKADAENARQGYAGSTTAIGVIKQNIDKLDKLQAQPGGGQNIIGSVANYMQGSAIGQRFAAATGSEVADARQKIKAAGQALLLSAAKGQGQLFRNQAEQKAFLESINNPQSTISAMRQALTLAQSRLLSPPSSAAAPSGRPAALPSRSTTRPAASGWGKAQVVQ